MLSQPLNILLTVPRLNAGGAETYTALLARQLLQQGIRVSVASGGGQISKQLEQDGIEQHYVPFRLHVGISTMLLGRLINKLKPDVVHANSANAAVVTAKACKAARTPWVMTAHGRLFRHQLKYQQFGEAFKMICVSDYLRNDIIAEGIYPAELLTTIPNGVQLQHFSMTPTEPNIRAELGIPPEAFTVGLIGRMFSQHRKGHHSIIKILASNPNCKEWHAILIGGGRFFSFFQEMAQSMGVADRVHFLGARQDIPQILPWVDAVALPTFSETFGLSLAEAMACGKPTVAYAVGGVPELVADEETGFLVPYQDEESLADRLVWLATHPDKARQMGLSARQRIEQHFTIDAMVNNMMPIYMAARDSRS